MNMVISYSNMSRFLPFSKNFGKFCDFFAFFIKILRIYSNYPLYIDRKAKLNHQNERLLKMNKFFKLSLLIAVIASSSTVMAGSRGVRLAADIVNLVGASAELIAPRRTTVVVNNPAPVVVTPAPVVVAPAPVVVTPAPVVAAPAPVVYHYRSYRY